MLKSNPNDFHLEHVMWLSSYLVAAASVLLVKSTLLPL
jgi:hypothetical protein